jgi:chaperonin cofactor prefoldin
MRKSWKTAAVVSVLVILIAALSMMGFAQEEKKMAPEKEKAATKAAMAEKKAPEKEMPATGMGTMENMAGQCNYLANKWDQTMSTYTEQPAPMHMKGLRDMSKTMKSMSENMSSMMKHTDSMMKTDAVKTDEEMHKKVEQLEKQMNAIADQMKEAVETLKALSDRMEKGQ